MGNDSQLNGWNHSHPEAYCQSHNIYTGMDHNLSRYENINNKHITDIAVGPRGQLVMVSRFGRVGFLVESEGGAGAMGFDSAAASRSPW